MSKIGHVEKSEIQHPGRKILFFSKNQSFGYPCIAPQIRHPTARQFDSLLPPKKLDLRKIDFYAKIRFPVKNYQCSIHENIDFTEIRPNLRKKSYLENPLRSGDRPVPIPLRKRNYRTRNYWTRAALQLRLNSGSTLPSFRVYKFQEKFRKSVKFQRNRYFLEWFC